MPRLPLRRYLFLLVIAGILPLAILSGAGLLALFEEQRRDTLDHAQGVTRALATAVDAELENGLSSLEILSTSPALALGDMAAFHAQARRALASQPGWLGLNLTAPSGERRVDAGVAYGAPMSPLLEAGTLEAAIRDGTRKVGVLAKDPGGRHAFALRMPVTVGGVPRHVLSAIVDPAAIGKILQRQQVDADWVISVFDSRGMRVARSRAHEQYLGTPAAESLRELMASGTREGAGLTRTLEGDSVFTAYSRLPGGWSVAIGIPEAEVNRTAARSIALYAAAVAASILLGLFAALWLARRANRSMAELRDAALALGRGERPETAKTEIAEVHDVGAAIVTAAVQRQAIESEREELLQREQAARSEAEGANRAKDQFLAMLAHELRNPLAAISTASALIEDARAQPDTVARAQGVIRRQTLHLARLTDDLLDAARALLGKIEVDAKPVDLAAVMAQSLRTLATTGRTAAHRIVDDLHESWIAGDSVRLDQVMCNLLENAVKYTPAGGTINLGTRREGDECVVTVSDTGVGIEPELGERVFDLFVQGKRDIDRKLGGLGIGLTLVKRLAELHGGSVSVQSAGPNRGSTFTLRFPAIERPASAPAPHVQAPATSRSILVVEDNDDARETLHTLLEMCGHRVEAARDGITGLEKALALAPDVAIIDIGLPGMDGFEVARRVRSGGNDRMLLIALTGYGTEEDRARVMAAGFDVHLIKPADLATLEALIARVAEREPAPG